MIRDFVKLVYNASKQLWAWRGYRFAIDLSLVLDMIQFYRSRSRCEMWNSQEWRHHNIVKDEADRTCRTYCQPRQPVGLKWSKEGERRELSFTDEIIVNSIVNCHSINILTQKSIRHHCNLRQLISFGMTWAMDSSVDDRPSESFGSLVRPTAVNR